MNLLNIIKLSLKTRSSIKFSTTVKLIVAYKQVNMLPITLPWIYLQNMLLNLNILNFNSILITNNN